MKLADVERLARGFEDGTLPLEVWQRHATHLAVSTFYLWTLPLADAIERVRVGIQRYNAAHGIAVTPTSGYHETVTLAFLRLLAARVLASSVTFEETLEKVLRELGDKRVLLEHYSVARLMSREARLGWVQPDLRPL